MSKTLQNGSGKVDRLKQIFEQNVTEQRIVRDTTLAMHEEKLLDNIFCLNKKKGDNERTDEEPVNYITAVNQKRNPDLLVPGGALKGNQYFKKVGD